MKIDKEDEWREEFLHSLIGTWYLRNYSSWNLPEFESCINSFYDKEVQEAWEIYLSACRNRDNDTKEELEKAREMIKDLVHDFQNLKLSYDNFKGWHIRAKEFLKIKDGEP